jgi:hypothetical protein
MIQFIKNRNYRLDFPDREPVTYTVQLRTSQFVFLHDGVGKQFRKQIFNRDGVEVCYMFSGSYKEPLVLSAKSLVERKAA